MSQAQDLPYQPKSSVIEDPPPPAEGFDYRTHIKDAKTSELIRVQPYRRFCIGNQVFLERPKMSGNLFYESGEQAGRRVAVGKDDKGNVRYEIDEKAFHVDFTEGKSSFVRADDIAAENESLRAELAALKSETEAKMKVAGPKMNAAADATQKKA